MLKKTIILLILLFVILGIYGLSKQIANALEASRRLDREADNFSKLQEENRKLKERLVKVSSIEFIEEQARNKLNLAKEGETIIIIPQEELVKVLGETKVIDEIKLPNWQAWLKLIFN